MYTAYNRFELLLTVVLPASYLRPKTKLAETTKTCHFRRRKRKRKRISVAL